MNVIESLLADAATIAALRREIHSYPELCYQEQRTSDLVAAKLTEWGIPIRRGLGKTSVVGIVKGTGGDSPRAIGLRAALCYIPNITAAPGVDGWMTIAAKASRDPGTD